jgi:hypothetical protein
VSLFEVRKRPVEEPPPHGRTYIEGSVEEESQIYQYAGRIGRISANGYSTGVLNSMIIIEFNEISKNLDFLPLHFCLFRLRRHLFVTCAATVGT